MKPSTQPIIFSASPFSLVLMLWSACRSWGFWPLCPVDNHLSNSKRMMVKSEISFAKACMLKLRMPDVLNFPIAVLTAPVIVMVDTIMESGFIALSANKPGILRLRSGEQGA